MNEGYRARRAAKHEAQAKEKKTIVAGLPVIDLSPSIPRSSFLNLKTRKQANGGRKNRSRHLPEHTEALVENGSRTFAAEVSKALQPDNEVVLENLKVAEQMSDII
ncbi:MAG: hypothetical protein C5B59_06620 [Bacteroidetes bacterium]|nr:MAG: hypothetical protein C5B59_06620 [Bacteroidota bacterium]